MRRSRVPSPAPALYGRSSASATLTTSSTHSRPPRSTGRLSVTAAGPPSWTNTVSAAARPVRVDRLGVAQYLAEIGVGVGRRQLVGCVNAFMQLVGTRGADRRVGHASAPGLGDPWR